MTGPPKVVIAEAAPPDACLSPDADQQAQAVGLFLNDSLLEIWPTGSLSQRHR
jgi:hypothetical protein